MKLKTITINIEEYEVIEELPQEDASLLLQARSALNGSYAPYSEFHVGAAALLANGKIVTGSNQENTAYPSGLCAERVALFYAQSTYPNVPVVAIAITAHCDHFVTTDPITPCGACRQVISEVEKRQDEGIRVIMQGERGKVQVVDGVAQLLPLLFHEEKLKKNRH